MKSVEEIYGNLENVQIMTLAPELENALSVVKELTDRGIIVSMGHSTADIGDGEKAVQNGATLITHLFNAMLPVSINFWIRSTIFFMPSQRTLPLHYEGSYKFHHFSSITVTQD